MIDTWPHAGALFSKSTHLDKMYMKQVDFFVWQKPPKLNNRCNFFNALAIGMVELNNIHLCKDFFFFKVSTGNVN